MSLLRYLLLALVLVVCPASSSTDDYDSHDVQKSGQRSFQWWDLYSMAEYIITTIKDNVMFQVYRKLEEVYNNTNAIIQTIPDIKAWVYNKTARIVETVHNKTAYVIEEVKNQVRYVVGAIYNNTAKVVEGLYNKTAAMAESIRSEIEVVGEAIYNKMLNETIKVAKRVYNKTAEFAKDVYESIEQFGEKVRTVMREEADSFVEMLCEEGLLGTLPENASTFRKLQRQAIQWGLIFLVVIICLIMDYYVMRILSTGTLNGIILIVTFNSYFYLMYQLLGPIYVLRGFLKIYGHLRTAHAYMLTHPTLTAIIINTAVVASVAYNCWVKVERFRRNYYFPQNENYASINRRLARIENQLETILNKLEKVKAKSTNRRRK